MLHKGLIFGRSFSETILLHHRKQKLTLRCMHHFYQWILFVASLTGRAGLGIRPVGFCDKYTRIQWCLCSVGRWSRTPVQLPLRGQYPPLNLLPNWGQWWYITNKATSWVTGIFLSANYPPVRYFLLICLSPCFSRGVTRAVTRWYVHKFRIFLIIKYL